MGAAKTRPAADPAAEALEHVRGAEQALLAVLKARNHAALDAPPEAPVCGLPAMHPGELLREETFKGSGRKMVEIVEALGVPRRTLYNVLQEKAPVSAELALRLQAAGFADADFWLRLQATYDLAKAREALGDQLGAIPNLRLSA